MSRPLILSALLALSACSDRTPITIECSVNDDLVFVAPGVTRWSEDAGTVKMTSEGRVLVRRMEANETCSEVKP